MSVLRFVIVTRSDRPVFEVDLSNAVTNTVRFRQVFSLNNRLQE